MQYVELVPGQVLLAQHVLRLHEVVHEHHGVLQETLQQLPSTQRYSYGRLHQSLQNVKAMMTC